MSDGPDMPRWVRITAQTDLWLVVRFVRPVWWIDYRFHINSYRQALAVLLFATAIQFAGTGLVMVAPVPWLTKFFLGIASAAYANMFLSWRRQLTKASRDYERDPDRMTIDRAFFHWQFVPPLRLMMGFMGLQLLAVMVFIAMCPPNNFARDWGFVAFNSWTLFCSVGLYIAAVPPSGRQRKKKEERAPIGALPMPA